MKLLKSLFLLIAVMTAVNISMAQDYKHPFNINEKGEAYNQQGVKLGWIENDTIIKNSKGEIVGKIRKSQVVNNVGKKMAEIQKDHSLKDNNGKIKFTISTADEKGICKILDPSGNIIGTVHENYKQQGACMLHCLQK